MKTGSINDTSTKHNMHKEQRIYDMSFKDEIIKAAKTKESFDTIFADIDTLIDMPHGEEYLADYLLANGVIVPPCKVGGTLYVISQMKDKRILPFVNEYEATYIQVGKRKCKVYHEQDGFIKIFLQDDFGKTVFLTREEAERALKEEVK